MTLNELLRKSTRDIRLGVVGVLLGITLATYGGIQFSKHTTKIQQQDTYSEFNSNLESAKNGYLALFGGMILTLGSCIPLINGYFKRDIVNLEAIEMRERSV